MNLDILALDTTFKEDIHSKKVMYLLVTSLNSWTKPTTIIEKFNIHARTNLKQRVLSFFGMLSMVHAVITNWRLLVWNFYHTKLSHALHDECMIAVTYCVAICLCLNHRIPQFKSLNHVDHIVYDLYKISYQPGIIKLWWNSRI